MTEQVVRYPEYRVYKPNSSNSGSALSFQIKQIVGDKFTTNDFFLVGVQQTGTDADSGNAIFGWKDQEKIVNMKLGVPDICELMTVLNGVKNVVGPKPKAGATEGMGLFHQNPKGNTVLKFKYNETPDREPCYYLTLSSKRDDKLITVKAVVSLAEAEMIKVWCNVCLKMELGI